MSVPINLWENRYQSNFGLSSQMFLAAVLLQQTPIFFTLLHVLGDYVVHPGLAGMALSEIC